MDYYWTITLAICLFAAFIFLLTSGELAARIFGVHPFGCLYIYASFTHFLRAFYFCFTSKEIKRTELNQKIRNILHPQSFVALSARTALDLWLSVKKFPKGSDFLIAAINIPDMSKVIREHGLIPVPVDVEVGNLFPSIQALEKTITKKTVAVLVAQLFGHRNPVLMDEIAIVTKKYGIPLIEDLAEGWNGPSFSGSDSADVTLFSFGPIKFNTAFGGGIAIIRDKSVFAQMNKIHDSYPKRVNKEMFLKLVKYVAVTCLVNLPFLTGLVIKSCNMIGFDHKKYLVSLLRGFPNNFFFKLRHLPDPALLALLEYSLRNFDNLDFSRSGHVGKLLSEIILKKSNLAVVPGFESPVMNYWLYPLAVQNTNETIKCLNAIGIDSYRGATQLNLVDRPEEYPNMETPPNASKIMNHIIYLPIHKGVSDGLVLKLGESVAQIINSNNDRKPF